MQLYTIQLRALDALMPYVAPKTSPDIKVQQAVQVVMPSAPANPPAPAHAARPVDAAQSSRMLPADVVWENEQKQQLSEAVPVENSDDEESK